MDLSRRARIKSLVARYRWTAVTVTVTSLLGGWVTYVLTSLVAPPSIGHLIFGLLLFAILLLAMLAFDLQKILREFRSSFEGIEGTVGRIAGRVGPLEIMERRRHYAGEKSAIVEKLAWEILPAALSSLPVDQQEKEHIGLMLDAGSTLEWLPARIRSTGLGRGRADPLLPRLRVFTNSLSAAEQYSWERLELLSVNQFTLFSGSPIEKYQAVIGPRTVEDADGVGDEYRKQGHTMIGFVTANWILVGSNYDRIILCSREPDHLEFKKAIVAASTQLLVVAPLGKLLCLDSADEFNVLLKNSGIGSYGGFTVCEQGSKMPEQRPTLLTTRRNSTNAILRSHSTRLHAAAKKPNAPYSLISLPYDPGGTREEQIRVEVPHHYMKDHLQLLQIW